MPLELPGMGCIDHSEGGSAAWGINEREAKLGEAAAGFLGSVAVAAALSPSRRNNAAWAKAGKEPVGESEGVFFMDILQEVFGIDKGNRSKYITEEMVGTLNMKTRNACLRLPLLWPT